LNLSFLGHAKKFSYAIRKARNDIKEQNDEHEAKRKRERAKQQRDEEQQGELANIQNEKELAKARNTRDVEDDRTSKKEQTMDLSNIPLPPGKDFHCFASHKVRSFLELCMLLPRLCC
jgi:hypothetical protein